MRRAPAALVVCLVAMPLAAAASEPPPTLTENPRTADPNIPEAARDALLWSAELAGLDAAAIQDHAAASQRPSATPAAAYERLVATLDTEAPLAGPAASAWLSQIPGSEQPGPGYEPGLAHALHILLDGLADAATLQAAAVQELNVDRATLLWHAYSDARERSDRQVLADAVGERTSDTHSPHTSTSGSLLPLGIDMTLMAASALRLIDAAETARPFLEHAARDVGAWVAAQAGSSSSTSAGLCIPDPLEVIIICGPFDDVISGNHVLEVDLGGNDAHNGNSGGSGLDILWQGNNGLPVALAIDVLGDDRYNGEKNVQGAGSSTPGILLDYEGDDLYWASNSFFTFSQGVGNLGGIGLLHDAVGDDTYLAPGDGFFDEDPAWDNQGFGILGGIGIIHDAAGDDSYQAGSMAQGVGDFQALGVLIDTAGWDFYNAKDRAQAFADGAGAGVLIEGQGNDDYVLRIGRGQGGAAGGHALLIDHLGNDEYTATMGSARGWGGTGPAWWPINEVLSEVGLELESAAAFVELTGWEWYDGERCEACIWQSGLGGVGIDSGF